MDDITGKEQELREAIYYLKDHLTDEWRDVVRYLGITDAIISDIEYDYSGSRREQIYQTFIKWKQINGNRATILALECALRNVGRRDLAESLEKGEHLDRLSSFQDVGSSVVQENTNVTNQMDPHGDWRAGLVHGDYEQNREHMREVDQQPRRKWFLLVVCVVIPVVAYLIYPDSASDEINVTNNNLDPTEMTEHKFSETDHLENAFRYVKNELIEEWRDVGRYLGLSNPDLEHINEQYNNNPKERNYQMLQKWRGKYGNKASIEALEDALQKAGRQDLVDNLHAQIRKEKTR